MVTITVIVPMAMAKKRQLTTKEEVAEVTPGEIMQQVVNPPSLLKNQEPPGQVRD